MRTEPKKELPHSWLWDRRLTQRQAKKILADPADPRFPELAALLLLRQNSPREVFRQYLKAPELCRNWPRIRKHLARDAWGSDRLNFWQAVYEKVRDRLKKRGVDLRVKPPSAGPEVCRRIGQRLKSLRRARGLTQQDLAGQLNISQQVVSRIESGRQNISLVTLDKIAGQLKARLDINS